MTRPRTLLVLVPLVTLGAPALATPAPLCRGLVLESLAACQDDLDALIDDRIAAVNGMTLDALWSEAEAVATLIGDEHGAAFDAALDKRLGTPQPNARGSLFLVSMRLFGDEIDREVLADALLPHLADGNVELSAAVADLFASAGFDRADEDLRERIADTLITVAEDGERPASLRARAACAGHKVGLGSQTSGPRKVLYDLMNSADPALRGQGALALAQLGIIEEVDGVEDELERMATLPGADGRLASAFLKQVRMQRFHDRTMARARSEQSALVAGGRVGQDLERVESLLDFVQRSHLEGDRFTREELLEAAMEGMLHSLDRHSSYFSPENYKRFEQDLEAEYGGIGAYVNNDPDDGLFTITRPIYSGPAYKAGLTTDDKIVRIGEWPTVGQKTDEVIKRLKGKPGTPVELYIWRAGMDVALIDRPNDEMKVVIDRGRIQIPPVSYEMLPGKIGLIELTTFSRVAAQEVLNALRDLVEEQGAEAIVLDLRNNTGGLLTQATHVAGLFLPKGTVAVKTDNRSSGQRSYRTEFGPVVPADMPVAVLINRFSASAAEIVSGALQDHGRAQLIGLRSYGKGSVQNLMLMPNERDDGFADENGNRRHDDWETLTNDQNGNGEFDYAPRIKLTVERYLLPSGRSIHRELDEEGNVTSPGGIEPDLPQRPRRYEQWRLAEMRRIQNTRKLREYSRKLMGEQPGLMQDLADGDNDDWSRYPDFDAVYNDLETILTRDDVRLLTRIEVRRAVQDTRGSAFPLGGDYQEDLQLQKALAQVLEEMGKEPKDIAEYARTFDPEEDPGATPPSVVARASELNEALALVAAAEVDGSLSKERIGELRELLESLRN